MKKFYAGMTQGIFATAVKADDAQGKLAVELVVSAVATGKAYAVTSRDAELRELTANSLQADFMKVVDGLIDIAMDEDRVEELLALYEDGKVAKEVYEYVVDMASARLNELETPVGEVAPVVVEAGVNLTADQVLRMMATRGLVIGGSCKTAMGEGTVLGFVVGQLGAMVVVAVDGKQHTVMATKVEGNEIKVEENVHMAKKEVQIPVQTKSEESVVSMNNPKASAPSLKFVAPVNEEAKAVVEQAVEEVVKPWEMTAEEREDLAEAKLQADLARFQATQEERSTNASAVANSSAAQALKALGGNAQKSQPAHPVVTAAPTVHNTNSNKGGYVQMSNNRQGSSAAFAGQQVTGRQSSAPSLTLAGTPVSNNGALAGWAGIEEMEHETDEFTRGANGAQNFVWYLIEAQKYQDKLKSYAELLANDMKNEALGIQGIGIYKPQDVVSVWGYEPRPEDFRYIEVFFGNLSLTFLIKRGTQRDGKPYIFSRNMGTKQRSNGEYYREFVNARRTDKLLVVVQQDGKVREARMEWKDGKQVVVEADAPFVQEIGGASWANENLGLRDLRVGQEVFIQVMLIADELSGLKAARESK